MGGLVNKVTDAFGLTDSGAAADGTREGYAASVAGQEEGLEYLRGVDEPIRKHRNAAMDEYAGMFLGGGQDLAEGIESDPFYEMVMGTLDDRQESYARTAGATGNLRGGQGIMGLGDIAADTRNEAFTSAYGNRVNERNFQTQGLQGLMGLPDYTADIYGGITGIGNTKGKGLIAEGQAKQDADQAGMDNLLGMGKLGVSAYTAGMFSDERLKENIEKINIVNGVNIYSWDWNEEAKDLGLIGSDFGVIAQEIKESHPEYIIDGDIYKVKKSFYEDVLFN